ncbi:EAL domain-containing protein, partial [Vibrio diabolicus]
MFYQKQHSTKDAEQYSYEALIRYKDEDGNLLSPTFIEDFHRLDAMPLLDKLVLEKVLSDMKEIGLSVQQRVAFNVSVATIQLVDFVQLLQ